MIVDYRDYLLEDHRSLAMKAVVGRGVAACTDFPWVEQG